MTQFRSIALAAGLIASAAWPALAQTASPDPAPAAPAATQPDAPIPDSGIKKAAPETRTHHKSHRHMHAKASVPATPPAHARG